MPDIADETVLQGNADENVRSDAPNADTKSLSDRLARAIEAAGGQLAVARLAGVSTKTLSRYKAGAPPKHSTLAAIAKATNVHLDWLATGRGPMKPGDPPPGQDALAAKPQETAPSGPLYLFPTANMDRLAAAYAAARGLLAQRGIHTPDPLDLVRIMCAIYDQLTEAEDKHRAP